MKKSVNNPTRGRSARIAPWATCMFIHLCLAAVAAAAPSGAGAPKAAAPAAPASNDAAAQDDGKGYTIEKPGTITFTVGVKIKGKVEKPQVMIFLPKERPQYREIAFEHSFKSDLMEPLPFKPNLE